jgi:hypothetical protein
MRTEGKDGADKNAGRKGEKPRIIRFIGRRKAWIVCALALLTAAAAAFMVFREDDGERANRLYYKGMNAFEDEAGFVKLESRSVLLVTEGDRQSAFRIRSSAEREGVRESRRWSAKVRRDAGDVSSERELYYEAGTVYQNYQGQKVAWALEAALAPDRLGVPELSFSSDAIKLAETKKSPGNGLVVSITLDSQALSERLGEIIELLGYEDEWDGGGPILRDARLTAEFARDGTLSSRTLSFTADNGSVSGGGRRLVCDLELKATRDASGKIATPGDLSEYEKAVRTIG